MSLSIVSLASGSKGNSILIRSKSTAILVDCGVAFTKLKANLAKYHLNPLDVAGVCITHEHNDHIKGIEKLSEYAPVFAHPLTARAIQAKTSFKNLQNVDDYENGFIVGDISVSPFRIPHDAVYPLAYTFSCDGVSISVATDIGKPTVGVFNNIKDSRVVLLESNHDIAMLKDGFYPEYLKSRILGKQGHLSNDDTALIAERLIGSKVEVLLLGHISESNNTPQLAVDTVNERLARHTEANIRVLALSQHENSEVFEVL